MNWLDRPSSRNSFTILISRNPTKNLCYPKKLKLLENTYGYAIIPIE